MSYVRKYGYPDLFITTITNPNWAKIQDNLLPGQEPHTRDLDMLRIWFLEATCIMV